jgi:hypothetical protein
MCRQSVQAMSFDNTPFTGGVHPALMALAPELAHPRAAGTGHRPVDRDVQVGLGILDDHGLARQHHLELAALFVPATGPFDVREPHQDAPDVPAARA